MPAETVGELITVFARAISIGEAEDGAQSSEAMIEFVIGVGVVPELPTWGMAAPGFGQLGWASNWR